jgi:uncharacterized protein (DUF362 family)/Pyruvate/2-oxoacid:ferredoxin oxidoreductase delta subunit
MSRQVVIKKCKEYKLDEVMAAIESGLELLGGLDKYVKENEKVLLKVNCLAPSEPEKAIITHPVFLQAVIRILKKKTKNIVVGDSPGFGSFTTSKKTGYREVAEAEGVTLVDFAEDGEIRNDKNVSYKTFKVTNYVNSVDKVINLPKLKTHGLMYMTMAVKNMFGTIAGAGKPSYHMRAGRDKMLFAQMLVDLYMAKPPVLNIVDGIFGMEGNGPGGGTPVNTGVIVMGDDGFAVDYVIPQIVGINPDRVYTNLAYRKSILKGAQMEAEVLGEQISDVKYSGFKPVTDSGEGNAPLNTGLFGIVSKNLKDLITPKQVYVKSLCTGCLSCVKVCPVTALVYDKKKKKIICDYDKCIRCFICQEICPEKAIVIKEPFIGKFFNKKK